MRVTWHVISREPHDQFYHFRQRRQPATDAYRRRYQVYMAVSGGLLGGCHTYAGIRPIADCSRVASHNAVSWARWPITVTHFFGQFRQRPCAILAYSKLSRDLVGFHSITVFMSG